MYIAYSAVTDINNLSHQTPNNQLASHENEIQLRYQAYQYTCNKFSNEIAEIQKYIPGWLPKFNR